MRTNTKRLLSGIAMAMASISAILLPSDAVAQTRGERHDQGRHEGGDQKGRNDRNRNPDRDRRDERWNRRDDDRRDRDRYRYGQDRRQDTKNDWRNLGIAGGAVGVYGLLTGNKTVAALGLGGGLYSAYRYEEDRKSQNRDSRDRYELFRRESFDHQGHHYERRTRNRDGQKYYYFQRTR